MSCLVWPEPSEVTAVTDPMAFKCLGGTFFSNSTGNSKYDYEGWKKFVSDNNCKDILFNYVYKEKTIFNPQNFRAVQGGYISLFSFLKEPLKEIDQCYNMPGGCMALQEMVCSKCKRESLKTIEEIIFCGCFVEPGGLVKERKIGVECDPYCSAAPVLKRVNYRTGEEIKCKDTVCVLSHDTVQVLRSTVGTVTFNQACPNCFKDCFCIADESLRGVFNVSQNCGKNSVCIKNGKVVPCEASVIEEPVPIIVWFISALLITIGVSSFFSYRLV
ncbi:MAG: hypothetical protein KatS3mg101_0802 [Patescibacteria group bacterium]|nr:MAG: hypothetical protein KatS3mg101_0802 [Patescibacteria group bacterium]